MRVLLVEDEVRLADTLSSVLRKERFIVDHAGCLEAAQEAAAIADFDLVLLDRTLPDGEGLSLVPTLRTQSPGVHIIVLSARGAVEDRVAGLDEGADDYLVKPFSIDEMLARIRAVRRRPTQLQG
jgi:DNA-binding response OmpR family regulator